MLTRSSLPRVNQRLDVVVDHTDLQRRRVHDDLVGGRCSRGSDLELFKCKLKKSSLQGTARPKIIAKRKMNQIY